MKTFNQTNRAWKFVNLHQFRHAVQSPMEQKQCANFSVSHAGIPDIYDGCFFSGIQSVWSHIQRKQPFFSSKQPFWQKWFIIPSYVIRTQKRPFFQIQNVVELVFAAIQNNRIIINNNKQSEIVEIQPQQSRSHWSDLWCCALASEVNCR